MELPTKENKGNLRSASNASTSSRNKNTIDQVYPGTKKITLDPQEEEKKIKKLKQTIDKVKAESKEEVVDMDASTVANTVDLKNNCHKTKKIAKLKGVDKKVKTSLKKHLGNQSAA